MVGAGIAGSAHTEISIVATLGGVSALLLSLDRGLIISVRIIITFFHDKPILASLSNIVSIEWLRPGQLRGLSGLVGKYLFKVSFCNN